jgi:hypothetical protein
MKQEIAWLEFWLNLSEQHPKLLPVTIHGTRHTSKEDLEKRLRELKK